MSSYLIGPILGAWKAYQHGVDAMTAIAAFRVSEIAVVFGDLMLSHLDDAIPTAHMPAAGNVAGYVTEDGYTFAGFSQKVVLISERCAIAWSGNYMAAGILIQELRRRAHLSSLTIDGIHRLLRESPNGKLVTMVGWLWQGQFLHAINHKARALDVRGLGQVFMGGSGSPTLYKTLCIQSESEMWSDDPIDAAATAFAATALLSGALLQRELHAKDLASKLEQLFGGAFEAALLLGNAFVKVGNITFVFWEAKVSGEVVDLQTPVLFFKQDYLHDFLLVKSGRFQYDVERDRIRGERHAYSVPPMYMTDHQVSVVEAQKMPFQSHYFFHIFFAYDIETDEEWRYANLTSIGASTGQPSVRFEESDQGLSWTTSDAFVAEAMRGLLANRPSR